MSVSLKCDKCGEAVADLSHPARILLDHDAWEVMTVSIEKRGKLSGRKLSVDFCRWCFIEKLMDAIYQSAPREGRLGERLEKLWRRVREQFESEKKVERAMKKLETDLGRLTDETKSQAQHPLA